MGGKGSAVHVLLAILGSGLVTAAAALPAAAATTLTLTVAPAEGPATGAFTMRLAVVFPVCPDSTVTFSWDTTSRTIASAPLTGQSCTATATGQPPAEANGLGQHRLIGRVNGSLSTTTTYTIVAAASPSPTPTRRPTPAPTPTTTPTPVPTPTPEPTPTQAPAPCTTNVPQATGSDGFLEVPGVNGGAAEPQHAGAVTIRGTSPASMLPPKLGTEPLTDVELVRPVDDASPALVRAVASGVHLDCVHLELGPGDPYLYVTYAFHDALLTGYSPSGSDERVTLTYGSVDWEYQPRDGSAVVTGRGRLGDTPNPEPLRTASMSPAPAMAVGALLLVAVVAGAVVLARRRRRRA